MRALLKLSQLRDETPGELGARAGKLSSLAFPEVVRDNAVMQAQLADLYVEALSDERVRHDVLKEGPLRLSAAVELAGGSQCVWDKVKRCWKRVGTAHLEQRRATRRSDVTVGAVTKGFDPGPGVYPSHGVKSVVLVRGY